MLDKTNLTGINAAIPDAEVAAAGPWMGIERKMLPATLPRPGGAQLDASSAGGTAEIKLSETWAERNMPGLPLALPVINRGWTWTSEFVPMPQPPAVGRVVLTNPVMSPPAFYRPVVRPKPAQATLRIGICGPARSGKDTVVRHLCEKYGSHASMSPAHAGIDIRRYAHADALKVEVFEWLQGLRWAARGNVAAASLSELILLPKENAVYTNADKIAFCDEHKKALRSVLQLWGSEYRRGQDVNYWVMLTEAAITLDRPQVALISDCRFANEVNGCHVTFRCEREGYVETDSSVAKHVSESELAGFKADFNLVARDGDVAGLLEQAEAAFERVLETFRVQ